jgi:hypothetical protein
MAKERKHWFGLRYPDDKIVFEDELGTQFQTTGLLLKGRNNKAVIVLQPNETDLKELEFITPTVDEWLQILKKLDSPEHVISDPSDIKIIKAIIGKNKRQIGTHIQWEVYRRDNYTCQYCKRNDVPLTIDHKTPVDLGGTDEQYNLVACCRSCNKEKGNMSYDEWMKIKSGT